MPRHISSWLLLVWKGPGSPPKWLLETGHPSNQSHIGHSLEHEDPALERNDGTLGEEEVPAVEEDTLGEEMILWRRAEPLLQELTLKSLLYIEGKDDTLGEEDDPTAEGGDETSTASAADIDTPTKGMNTARTTSRARSLLKYYPTRVMVA